MCEGTIREFGQVTTHEHSAADSVTGADSLQGRSPEIGELKHYSDGRSYVRCSTDADLVAGEMVGTIDCSTAEIANGVTAAGIGAVELTIATTGTAMFGGAAGVIAVDRLADGYLHLTDDAGENYCYRIVSNAAGTAAVALVVTIEAPGLVVAVTATTDCVLTGPRFRAVIQNTAALAAIGAAQVATTASSTSVTEHLWVQYKGIATVQNSAGCTAGDQMASAAGGQVATAAAATDDIVGTAIATTGNGACAMILDVQGMPDTK